VINFDVAFKEPLCENRSDRLAPLFLLGKRDHMETTRSPRREHQRLEDKQAVADPPLATAEHWAEGAFGSDVSFTPRELGVLELICQADSTKEIAWKLGISFKTAACHRSRILGKAGVRNTVALFRWAIKNGYVKVETPGAPRFVLRPRRRHPRRNRAATA
jgi:DNA-binding CsgD family transcriptional regulator